MCRSVKSVFEPSGICVRPALISGFFSMASRCISNLSFGGMLVNHRATPSISCTPLGTSRYATARYYYGFVGREGLG